MILKQLLERLEYEVVQGSDKIEITTLINDSRKVEEGSVFVCISGAVSDGHQYVADVAKKGAKTQGTHSHLLLPLISAIRQRSCTLLELQGQKERRPRPI